MSLQYLQKGSQWPSLTKARGRSQTLHISSDLAFYIRYKLAGYRVLRQADSPSQKTRTVSNSLFAGPLLLLGTEKVKCFLFKVEIREAWNFTLNTANINLNISTEN